MSRSNPLQITPTEMARALGKTNPDPVRAAPAPWHYPVAPIRGRAENGCTTCPARHLWSLSEPAGCRNKGV